MSKNAAVFDLRQMRAAVDRPNASRSGAVVAWIERSEIRERWSGFHRRSPDFTAFNPGYDESRRLEYVRYW
jgi:hypothetical protein